MRLLVLIFFVVSSAFAAGSFELVLPTVNDYLFKGKPEKFYMYVPRNFEGKESRPWQGGAFGFVRTPRRISGKVIMTKFHEGIDISPIKRDRIGNPMDLVMSVSYGTVVYVNTVSARSNYGRYVVVEHEWDGSKIYSLYAHLSKISVKLGDEIRTGGVLGQMGYTGRGLNRTRAHLHLEIGFLMSYRYGDWHASHFGSMNYHGVFNGMNLSGVDVASLFLERRENSDLKFSEFVKSRKAQFKIIIPAEKSEPSFLKRHPWMRTSKPSSSPSAWEIGFAATGHPISFSPHDYAVSQPTISQIRPADINQKYLTRGLVAGSGKSVSLTVRGKQLVSLVTEIFPEK